LKVMGEVCPHHGGSWATNSTPATNHTNGTTMATNLTDTETSMALTIDDIETKRAHMHRMLVSQRFLLRNALDAIRAGDNHVADEMVDRFLAHVDAELTYQQTPERTS
jgi:hypothetical protein